MNPNRKNLANGILALGVSTSDTTWVLESGYGGAMPAVPFFLTATPFGQLSTIGNSEIVNVTTRSGDTLTVQRAQKGTTARTFAAGSVVSNGIYVEDKVGSENIDWATLAPSKSQVGSWEKRIFPSGVIEYFFENTTTISTAGGAWGNSLMYPFPDGLTWNPSKMTLSANGVSVDAAITISAGRIGNQIAFYRTNQYGSAVNAAITMNAILTVYP